MPQTRIEVNITRYETAVWQFDGVVTEEEALERVRTRARAPLWTEVHDEELDPLEITIRRDDEAQSGKQ